MKEEIKAYNSVLELIGNTPLIKLSKVSADITGNFYAKVEAFNPGHSTKDRIALYIIEEAEKRGILKPGDTIVETTSGNTGFSLAMVSIIKGYDCILAVSSKSSKDKIDMLLGASVGSKIYAPMEGKRSVNSLKIYTEDGSMGETGRVTQSLLEIIENRAIDVIYSCGPMGMLQAITELVSETDVIHQCAVEESMACGIGICMTCVLPVTNADGTTSMLRSCIDGPVMDGSNVRWDLVGKVPDSL